MGSRELLHTIVQYLLQSDRKTQSCEPWSNKVDVVGVSVRQAKRQMWFGFGVVAHTMHASFLRHQNSPNYVVWCEI